MPALLGSGYRVNNGVAVGLVAAAKGRRSKTKGRSWGRDFLLAPWVNLGVTSITDTRLRACYAANWSMLEKILLVFSAPNFVHWFLTWSSWFLPSRSIWKYSNDTAHRQVEEQVTVTRGSSWRRHRCLSHPSPACC